MRRKENPLGWVLPEQSIKGLLYYKNQLQVSFPFLSHRLKSQSFCHKFRSFCYILLKYEKLIGSGKFHGK
ncbi:hypothetical protein T08_5168 [Trichinella sp. T8]|nr:hypothetical protein T08_5168 [Trichinella sp. T8]